MSLAFSAAQCQYMFVADYEKESGVWGYGNLGDPQTIVSDIEGGHRIVVWDATEGFAIG